MNAEERRSRRRFTVDALFTDTRPQAVGTRDLADARIIDLDRIQPDPAQPRRSFDSERLDELADSIRLDGVLQPIAVRYDADNDRYIIIHGERRWRAAVLAGLQAIPAIVRDIPKERRLVQQLVENVQREDLNAVDRASALQTLREQMGNPPWDTIADTIGIKRSRLFQLLGTKKLGDNAQDDIRAGRLSEKQSRALQGLPENKQEVLREYIIAHSLSAPSAIRLGRAWRDYVVVDNNDGTNLQDALIELGAFVFGADQTQRKRQTDELLSAIRAAVRGDSHESRDLERLASALDAARFETEQFERGTNLLARSLAAISSDQLAAVRSELSALQETIGLLLEKSDDLS